MDQEKVGMRRRIGSGEGWHEEKDWIRRRLRRGDGLDKEKVGMRKRIGSGEG